MATTTRVIVVKPTAAQAKVFEEARRLRASLEGHPRHARAYSWWREDAAPVKRPRHRRDPQPMSGGYL